MGNSDRNPEGAGASPEEGCAPGTVQQEPPSSFATVAAPGQAREAPPPAGGRLRRRAGQIALFFLALLGAAGLTILLLMPIRFLPSEDAVILYDYSRNFAGTGIISYFPHGPRVEGATDFLYMVILALGIRVGIAPYLLSCILSALSALGISALLLRLAGIQRSAFRLLACAGLLFLLPPVVAAAQGFSVLPFAFLITALVCLANAGRMPETGLCALILCLLRPDGVVFAVPLLLYEIFTSQERRRRLLIFLATFLAPGLVYFLWRWHYFGEFFPLPFLVKSDAARAGGIFVDDSVHSIQVYLGFALLLSVVAGMRCIGSRENLRILFCLIFAPTFFYCTMRLDQNIASRFFLYLPLAALIMAATNWQSLHRARAGLVVAAIAMWAICFALPYIGDIGAVFRRQYPQRQQIARDLSGLSHRHTMLVTESGILPYDSRWVAYDAWGLNTPRFAHRLLQPEDVRELSPDLIELHVLAPEELNCAADPGLAVPYQSREWSNMTRNLLAGIPRQEYSLWRLSFGYGFSMKHLRESPSGIYECWFVRRADPDYDRIVAILARDGAIPQAEYLSKETR